MEIRQRKKGSLIILDLSGDIKKPQGTNELDAQLCELVESGHKKIVLNMSKVGYLDSGTVGTIIATYKKIKDSGDLIIVEPSQEVFDIITLVGMDSIIKIYQSEEELEQG